jgi:hypothetical protein
MTTATSWATQTVKIWADNDKVMYTHLQQFVHDENLLAEQIKAYIEHLKEYSDIDGLLADLLNTAIHEVDYREVAKHFID